MPALVVHWPNGADLFDAQNWSVLANLEVQINKAYFFNLINHQSSLTVVILDKSRPRRLSP